MSTPDCPPSRLLLEPGTLWQRTIERSRHALASGAQEPIPTTWELVEQAGVHFMVRIVNSLARKTETDRLRREAARSSDFDPYLPYEEELFVADLSESHVCLLNKFNVIEHHLLIVTRAFEDQEQLISLADLEAMWACMAEIDGLAFYNGGAHAGASQRHKHLQLVPLPFAPEGPRVPIEPALARTRPGPGGRLLVADDLPFAHALAPVESAWLESPQRAARETLACYRAMLEIAGVPVTPDGTATGYNLLVTRSWMLLAARARESVGPISVNALGFAGSLFVRNDDERRLLLTQGPMRILQAVGVPRA